MTIRYLFFRLAVVGVWCFIFACFLYGMSIITLFSKRKTITIAAWSDILDTTLLQEFQKKYGIDLQVSYFSSNEELLVKLKKTSGNAFDLIIPSDYAVKLLIEQGLLKKLDKSKLTFYGDLNPILMGHDCDPHNDYALPLFWEIFGVGINKEVFDDTESIDPWKLIFNTVTDHTITMVNDPIEMVMLASLFLFGTADTLDAVKLKEVEGLLKQQKKIVKAYVDFRGDYFLATRNCAAIVSSSSYILRAQKQFPFIGFLVPQKTFVTIEHCALSKGTKHDDSIYLLLNYIYKKESVIQHCEQFCFFPATLSALGYIRGSEQQSRIASMDAEHFSRLLFFKKQMKQIDLIRIWASIKS